MSIPGGSATFDASSTSAYSRPNDYVAPGKVAQFSLPAEDFTIKILDSKRKGNDIRWTGHDARVHRTLSVQV